MKRNQKAFALADSLILMGLVVIVGLLAIIVITGVINREHARQNEQKSPVRIFTIDVRNGSEVDLANKLGATNVAENSVGYGDALLKGQAIIDTVPFLKVEIDFVDHAKMIQLTNRAKGIKYRSATLREILSFRLSSDALMDRNIVAMGTCKQSVPNDRSSTSLYPIIHGDSLSFGYDKDWPADTLFAIVRMN